MSYMKEPQNDGRNWCETHRWEVVAPRPLCFGSRGVGISTACLACRETIAECYLFSIAAFSWTPEKHLVSHLKRQWLRIEELIALNNTKYERITELHEENTKLRKRNDVLETLHDAVIALYREHVLHVAAGVHLSDCSVYNGPAYEADPCDCGAVRSSVECR